MHYDKQKRDRFDKCNICGNYAKLTWDHVPPKICFNTEKTEYTQMFGDIEKERSNQRHNITQNGIKYRSICETCNNCLLGSNYDKELEKLIKELTLKLMLPSVIKISINVNKLARSVAGHILAAKNNYDADNLVDIGLREFVLDSSSLPPRDTRLLFRLYPYDGIFIIRDVVVRNLYANHYPLPNGMLSCLSFYPIAFILCQSDFDCGLLDLFPLCSNDPERMTDVQIDLLSYRFPDSVKIRDPEWPCNITDNGEGVSMVLAGNSIKDSVVTQKRL